MVFLLLVIVGACVGLVFLFEQRKNRQEEQRRYESMAKAPEKAPTLFPVSDDPVFANPEEEWLNREFRTFLRRKNESIQASAHLEYLESKIKALYFLGRSEEAGQLNESLTQARNALAKVQVQRNITFNSRYCASFYRTPPIKQAYTAFSENLPNERMNPVGDFFQNPQAKVVKLSPTSAWVFTPFYVVVYQGTGKKLQIVTYREFSLSARLTSERLSGRCEAFDEIEHIGYRYETKNGSRDMRSGFIRTPVGNRSEKRTERKKVKIRCLYEHSGRKSHGADGCTERTVPFRGEKGVFVREFTGTKSGFTGWLSWRMGQTCVWTECGGICKSTGAVGRI